MKGVWQMTDTEERERAMELMSHPLDWPRWPRLPLKRHKDGMMELGCLISVDEDVTEDRARVVTPRVWFATLFEEIKPGETPSKRYTDFAGLLDDGWRID